MLDASREELRKHDYIPVLFDFDKPTAKDLHETITTLVRMSRFVIAEITDAKSIPQELVSIVEQLSSLPVQPILQQIANHGQCTITSSVTYGFLHYIVMLRWTVYITAS